MRSIRCDRCEEISNTSYGAALLRGLPTSRATYVSIKSFSCEPEAVLVESRPGVADGQEWGRWDTILLCFERSFFIPKKIRFCFVFLLSARIVISAAVVGSADMESMTISRRKRSSRWRECFYDVSNTYSSDELLYGTTNDHTPYCSPTRIPTPKKPGATRAGLMGTAQPPSGTTTTPPTRRSTQSKRTKGTTDQPVSWKHERPGYAPGYAIDCNATGSRKQEP